VEALADRIYSLGVTNIMTITPKDQDDLVAWSRALRRLLRAYEQGRPPGMIMLSGFV
jgi:hypothetical protein